MALLYCLDRDNPRLRRLFRDRVGIDHLRDAEVVSRYRLLPSSLLYWKMILPNRQEDRLLFSLMFRFPRDRLNSIKHGFFRQCGLPNVVGAVDGTLIPIQGPSENEAIYVCRKGYHAINVQAVVDSNMRFLDIVTRWPGSQHDAFIFENCGLKTVLESDDVGYLLGDSGYPLRKYLITPIANPSTRAEENFNECHMKGRLVVEKAFGVLKSRFRCLHKTGGVLPFKPSKSCKVAEACFRLHNFCLDRRVPLPETVEPDDSNDTSICCVPPDRTGQHRRRSLVDLCA